MTALTNARPPARPMSSPDVTPSFDGRPPQPPAAQKLRTGFRRCDVSINQRNEGAVTGTADGGGAAVSRPVQGRGSGNDGVPVF